MARSEPNDKPNNHAREDRHNSLMHGPYAFDLEVVRGEEGEDEQDADDEERPAAVLFLLCRVRLPR